MKPKDLISPFNWKGRHVHLEEGVLYVPDYCERYDLFQMPPWASLFGNERPVAVEFCSGHGHWIVDRAEREPETNWVAVELQFGRVQKIWSKRENRRLKNLFIVCGDARLLARHYLHPQSVAAAYVNFPDPWPKKRHAKHRLIQTPFTGDLYRALKPGGEVTLVTDDLPYRDQMVEEMGKEGLFQSHLASSDWESYGSSYFGALWHSLGRKIHILHFLSIGK